MAAISALPGWPLLVAGTRSQTACWSTGPVATGLSVHMVGCTSFSLPFATPATIQEKDMGQPRRGSHGAAPPLFPRKSQREAAPTGGNQEGFLQEVAREPALQDAPQSKSAQRERRVATWVTGQRRQVPTGWCMSGERAQGTTAGVWAKLKLRSV